MAGLMYKNLLLYRTELIVVGALQLLISATVLLTGIMGSVSPGGTLVLYCCMFLTIGFTESGLFAPDEKQSARNFLISAPTGAAGHIESKYWFLLLLDLGVMILCFLTDTAVFALTGDENAMTGVILVLLFSMSLLVDALSLPFIVYFGTGSGLSVKASALGVILVLVLTYALFGDISYFLSHDFMTAVEKLLEDGNVLLMLGLLPYLAGFLYWLSAKLSVALFRKGAENYE